MTHSTKDYSKKENLKKTIKELENFKKLENNEFKKLKNDLLNIFKNIKFITPTYGNTINKNFIAIGNESKYKIPVFLNEKEYYEGLEFLNIKNKENYEQLSCSFDLFVNLANNDKIFNGLIVNIASENIEISRDILLQFINEIKIKKCGT